MEIRYADDRCLTETVQLKSKKKQQKEEEKWVICVYFVSFPFIIFFFCLRIDVCVRPHNNNVK